VGTSKWKVAVHERDCFRCKICGSTKQLTVHHRLPVARKGKGTLENCVCWCRDCHRNYHKIWGITTSDDYGNPVGEYRNNSSKNKKKKHKTKKRRR
jgi:predicted restriction endonuclease